MENMSKELIAFFSRAGENYFGGSYRYVNVRNTEIVAGMIHELTDAEMFRIDPVNPYSEDYETCTAEAKEGQRRDARPEILEYPDGLDGYDTVYLGYPNYWGTCLCPFSRSWSGSISPERPSDHSVRTKGADWGVVSRTSRGYVLMRLWNRVWHWSRVLCVNRKRSWPVGWDIESFPSFIHASLRLNVK